MVIAGQSVESGVESGLCIEKHGGRIVLLW